MLILKLKFIDSIDFMTYKAYYYLRSNSGRSPLTEYLKTIRNPSAVIEIFAMIDFLLDEKCELPPPYIKHVWKKIYELRFQHQRNQYRVFYFIVQEGKIILLTGYTKKTQKIPKNLLRQIQHYYLDYLKYHHEEEFKNEIPQRPQY